MRKATRAPAGLQPYKRVPNFNLVPVLPRRKLLSSQGRMALVFVFVGMAALAALLLRQNADENRAIELNAEYQSLQSRISAANARKPEVDRLKADIAALEQGGKDYSTLVTFSSWSRFLVDLQRQVAVTGVTLTSVRQNDSAASVSGWTQDADPTNAVFAFYRGITESPVVAVASLASLSKVPGDTRFSFVIDIELKDNE